MENLETKVQLLDRMRDDMKKAYQEYVQEKHRYFKNHFDLKWIEKSLEEKNVIKDKNKYVLECYEAEILHLKRRLYEIKTEFENLKMTKEMIQIKASFVSNDVKPDVEVSSMKNVNKLETPIEMKEGLLNQIMELEKSIKDQNIIIEEYEKFKVPN